MAFPTSPSNNQVHKEGNRSFVYDSALGTWEIIKEADTGGFMTKGTELGTITGGEWKGTQISQCVQKNIGYSGDVSNTTTVHYIWSDQSRLNMVMKTTAPTIAYIATSSECFYDQQNQYTYWRINAQRGTNSLGDFCVGNSLVSSDLAVHYTRYAENKSFNITISGTMAMPNCKAGETWCFAPSFALKTATGTAYSNYVGGNGKAHLTIIELG